MTTNSYAAEYRERNRELLVEKQKKYYRENKERYTEANRERRRENRIKGTELLGDYCWECADTEGPFEFDHIDPSTKWTHKFWTYSWTVIETELSKCQLLCVPCHKVKTKMDKQVTEHGFVMYKNHKCRCEVCVSAHSVYQKEYRRRNW